MPLTAETFPFYNFHFNLPCLDLAFEWILHTYSPLTSCVQFDLVHKKSHEGYWLNKDYYAFFASLFCWFRQVKQLIIVYIILGGYSNLHLLLFVKKVQFVVLPYDCVICIFRLQKVQRFIVLLWLPLPMVLRMGEKMKKLSCTHTPIVV